VYEVSENRKYVATMDFLEGYFVQNKRAVATGLPLQYCADLWDKLAYCPYEMALYKDFVVFKNPYNQ
jgi:hypothetical protein